jgi:flagellar basal-body rod protein FlgG
MIRALYSSAAGMQTQQTNLDVISNNLANVNTTGYKKTKAEFQDLLYQNTRGAGADQGNGSLLPTGIQIGHGSQLVATSKVFTTGDFTRTDSKFDVAIQGDGFFEVTTPDGQQAFTRDGAFKIRNDGNWVTSDGLVLVGFAALPPTTTDITISPEGIVSARQPDGTNQTFQINLTRFANAAGLQSIGRNLYRTTPASGQPEVGTPNQNGFGSLSQGYLEMSNVKVVEEMVNMIVAQRAYEVNSKAVQASDDMMQTANNLRR